VFRALTIKVLKHQFSSATELELIQNASDLEELYNHLGSGLDYWERENQEHLNAVTVFCDKYKLEYEDKSHEAIKQNILNWSKELDKKFLHMDQVY
jgi:hypothetical protein